MGPTKEKNEIKYIQITESSEGVGSVHKEALCHIAYITALDTLGLASNLSNEQIRKFTSKKTVLLHDPLTNELELAVHIPVKRDLNIYNLMKKAQKEIKQNFEDLLAIKIDKVDLIVDQVIF
jgi:Protein of unknown function (DUF322).